MFTGIVEEIGEIVSLQKGEKSEKLTIKGDIIFSDMHLGDSIAVNGVCLTVDKMTDKTFTADVMPETMKRTSFKELSVGSSVNLERAMTIGGRFGGHIVSGHIDGTGTIYNMVRDDNATVVSIKADRSILKYIIEKGSITIDGVSLTVTYVDNEIFKVSLIPHTASKTILLRKKVGDTVNLENDIVGKYVEKLLSFDEGSSKEKSSNIDEDFLARHGFM